MNFNRHRKPSDSHRGTTEKRPWRPEKRPWHSGKSQWRSEKGARAEQEAERFLQKRGLRTRTRNYRCKSGEIDLIMSEEETLVFVEVRLRRRNRFASAAETVDYRKQQKLIRAAHHYLQRTGLTDKIRCRFDVVAFDPDDRTGTTWLRDAFGAG